MAGGKILIVDNDKPFAHALALKLKEETFDVKTVSNGKQALKLLKNAPYAVLLVDIEAKDVDGFAILSETIEKNAGTKIIATSITSDNHVIKEALKLGAIDCFVKSNTPLATIVETVKNCLK